MAEQVEPESQDVYTGSRLREQVAREVGAVRGLHWPNGPVASAFALREADAAIGVVLGAVADEIKTLLAGDGPKDYDEGPGYERALADLSRRLGLPDAG